MQQYKFDLDVIIRDCERFDVKVEKGEGLRGMTMNGEEFDVAEVMELESPDKRHNSSNQLRTIDTKESRGEIGNRLQRKVIRASVTVGKPIS